VISAGAFVAALVAIDQGWSIYEARKLPRPAWRSELLMVQSEADLTNIVVLQLQLDSLKDQLNALLVAKATAQVVPPEFSDIEADLGERIAAIQDELNLLRSKVGAQ
jgi:hypothetical protein